MVVVGSTATSQEQVHAGDMWGLLELVLVVVPHVLVIPTE
jgi:hypothetical protein